MSDLSAELASRVKALREERGWSMFALSLEADMDKQIVYRLEHQKYGISMLTTLSRLADAFGLELVLEFKEAKHG